MEETSEESLQQHSISSDFFLQHIDCSQLQAAFTPPRKSTRSPLWPLMERKIRDRENTDLQVHIDDTLIHCHLLPLQCFSEYFEQEVQPGQAVVKLPAHQVPSAAFQIVYDWILDPNRQLEWEHFVSVLSAAEFLRMPALIERCWQHLDSPKVVENVAFFVFLQARKFRTVQLQPMMLRRICRFFLSLVSTPEYCELSLDELSVLLGSNIIGVFDETDVLYAACQWLLYDWSARKDKVECVMQLVRFERMRAGDLARFCVFQECAELQPILRHPATKELVDRALASICSQRQDAAGATNSGPDGSGSGWNIAPRLPTERVRLIPDTAETLAFVAGDTSYDGFNEFLYVLCSKPGIWQTFRLSEDNVGLLQDMFGDCSLTTN
uniref:BACK domain-containing protein n=1 Tax=Anopheles stephensi TaxID=30069 RepID=A0A182YP97_ANOST